MTWWLLSSEVRPMLCLCCYLAQGLSDPEPMLSPSQHTSQEQHTICLLENDQIYFKRTALLLSCTLPLAAWTLKSLHCEHMVGEHGSSVGKQKSQLQCINDASTLPTSHSTLK